MKPGKVLWQSEKPRIFKLYVMLHFLFFSWKSGSFNADTTQVSTAALKKGFPNSVLWTVIRDHNHMQQV